MGANVQTESSRSQCEARHRFIYIYMYNYIYLYIPIYTANNGRKCADGVKPESMRGAAQVHIHVYV